MTSGERLGNNPAYYVWQAPSDVLSIHLSLKVVADLTREHLRAIARDLPWEFRGVLLGHSVPGPNPATFVEDVALIPANAGDKNIATATDDDLAEIACRLNQGLDRGRNAIGFFRSQREGGLIPSTRDLKIVNRLFPRPENVMMLIRFALWRKPGRVLLSREGQAQAPRRELRLPLRRGPVVPPENLPAPDRSAGARVAARRFRSQICSRFARPDPLVAVTAHRRIVHSWNHRGANRIRLP